VTVYITQHQIMSRGGPVDPQQQKIQRVMLYGSPILLAVFGFRFPIAVLVYWLVTNTWSMAQQVFILRKMPPVLPGTSAGTASTGRTSGPGKGGPSMRKGAPPEPPPPPAPLKQVRKAPDAEPPPPQTNGNQSNGNQATGSADPPKGADSNGSAGSESAGSGSGSGRTVSGGGQPRQQPRRNNRPAAKPKGKGPRKGGRR
jgi:YidC/Oxa1 family membrane protein insertase